MNSDEAEGCKAPRYPKTTRIGEYLNGQGIDTFAVVPTSQIAADAGHRPEDLLAGARSVVVFGKAVPAYVYRAAPGPKTAYIHRLIDHLDATAFGLADLLQHDGYRAVPAVTFFPVTVESRQLRGMLPLKAIAAAGGLGTIGRNTLLISPEWGNRLALAAVVTDLAAEGEPGRLPGELCTGCNRCVAACPTGAIGEFGVDATRCLNVTGSVPRVLRPLFRFIIRRQNRSPFLELLINTVAWHAEMTCSRCLTACPRFAPSEERE